LPFSQIYKLLKNAAADSDFMKFFDGALALRDQKVWSAQTIFCILYFLHFMHLNAAWQSAKACMCALLKISVRYWHSQKILHTA